MRVEFPANETLSEHSVLQKVTKQMEEILGKSADNVTAQWIRQEQKGQSPVYILKLADFTGEVSAAFTPEDLPAGRNLRSRLLELWGDLLQVRSHRLLDKLSETAAEA